MDRIEKDYKGSNLKSRVHTNYKERKKECHLKIEENSPEKVTETASDLKNDGLECSCCQKSISLAKLDNIPQVQNII